MNLFAGPAYGTAKGAGSAYSEREVVFIQPGTHSPERTDLPAQKGTDRELEGSLESAFLRTLKRYGLTRSTARQQKTAEPSLASTL